MKQIGLRALVTVGLLAVIGWHLSPERFASTFARMNVGWWGMAFAVYLIAQVVSAFRWRALAEPLGFTRPLRRYLSLYFVGVFFNQLLPTSVGGDLVRGWHLAEDRFQRGRALLSVLADRLSGLAMLVCLAAGASFLIELPTWARVWTWLMVGAMVLGGLMVLFLMQRPVSLSASELGPMQRFLNKMRVLLESYRSRPLVLARAIGLASVIQSLNVILVWFLVRALGMSVPLSYCFVAIPLVTLLTLIPLSINGLGAREGGMIALLAPLGIATENAVALSLLWLSIFLVTGLMGGCVYFMGSFSRRKEQRDDGSLGGDSDQGRAGEYRAAA